MEAEEMTEPQLMTWRGCPIEEMTRDELIAVVRTLAAMQRQTSDRLLETHARNRESRDRASYSPVSGTIAELLG